MENRRDKAKEVRVEATAERTYLSSGSRNPPLPRIIKARCFGKMNLVSMHLNGLQFPMEREQNGQGKNLVISD